MGRISQKVTFVSAIVAIIVSISASVVALEANRIAEESLALLTLLFVSLIGTLVSSTEVAVLLRPIRPFSIRAIMSDLINRISRPPFYMDSIFHS